MTAVCLSTWTVFVLVAGVCFGAFMEGFLIAAWKDRDKVRLLWRDWQDERRTGR